MKSNAYPIRLGASTAWPKAASGRRCLEKSRRGIGFIAIAVLVVLAGCARDFDTRKGRVVYGPPKPGEVIDAIPRIETGDDGGGDGGGHGD